MKKLIFIILYVFVQNLYGQGEINKSTTNSVRFQRPAQERSLESKVPFISVFLPEKVKESTWVLQGKAKMQNALSEIKINNKEVAFMPKTGEFTHNLALVEGKNNFVILAKDEAGNTESKTYSLVYQPERKAEEKQENVGIPAEKIGQNYILALACQDYQYNKEINDLQKPVQDAQEVVKTLTSVYTFDNQKVIFKRNPTRTDIIEVFDSLVKVLGEKDNLLIFYAGHAHYDSDLKKGYWLPTDAKASSRANWFSNDDLRTYIGTFKTKHTLLVADACFSGSILRDISQDIRKASYEIQKLYGMPSRKAMTSGTMKPVPDNSVFIKYLLKNLTNNTEKYMTASSLFGSFRETVIKNSPNFQVPQYGDIHEAGDEGGEFIFIKK